MTSPSLVIYKTAAYARCLGGKRLQRTCASQLKDDGWEKESAFLFLLLQLSQAHMSQRSAEGVLTVLTHCVDTSALIFQGERLVTWLYWGEKMLTQTYKSKNRLKRTLTRSTRFCQALIRVITGEGLGSIVAKRPLGWIKHYCLPALITFWHRQRLAATRHGPDKPLSATL